MRSLRSLTAPLAALLALGLTLFTSSLVTGQEHLRNGAFDGSTGWVLYPTNASIADCGDGNTGLRLAPPANQHAFGRQRIEGPLAAGSYRVSGKIKRVSGTASVDLDVLRYNEAEDVLSGPSQATLSAGAAYTPFLVEFTTVDGTHSVVLGFSLTSGSNPSIYCLDDVSFEGPPLATPTPIPTDTPAATSTATTAASATVSSTPLATATATRTPPPGLVFRNGSFEDGAEGWQKFGGELHITDTPRVSGLHAGVLSSATASTKWAYQTVAIDPLRHYQFSGHLQASAGVATALLRISWYATADGSGEALSTTDSTASVAGGASGYVFLTTGPVQPPAGAKTARPRVLLMPAGATEATLYMDDLDFLVVEAATATAVATSVPPATISTVAPAASTPAPQRTSAAATAVIVTSTVPPEPPRVSDVSSTRIVVTPTPRAEVLGVRTQPPDDNEGVPLIWLVATGALVVGLGGAYVQKRRRT